MRHKIAIVLLLFLVVFSLACEVAYQQILPTPTITSTATITPTSTITPSPTLTPTLTATVPPPPIENCNDANCLQACLDRIKVVMDAQPFTPLETEDDEDATVVLVKYKVVNGEFSRPNLPPVDPQYEVYQNDTDAHQRIWDYFTAILPPEQMKWIAEFYVFTDGKSNKLAYVRRSNREPDEWILGADILDSRSPVALTETLLHEFGHLLTLNTDQMTVDYGYYPEYQGAGGCRQYASAEGCANSGSYMDAFYQSFWTGLYREWYQHVYLASGGTLDWQLVRGLYRRYPEQFNTDYSASSPEEDMAESFVAFLLNPKPDDDTIASQKAAFFYTYPELVELRSYIIQGICSYVQE